MALLLIFGVPLFAFVVLTTVFSHPVIRGLGVTVVDEDKSDASRALVEYIAASPSLKIVDRSGTLSTAVQDIRSGKSISAVHIPPDFERDLKAARRPQIVGFYNQQFLTPSGIASSVVDEDKSDASRALVEYIAASPSLKIVDRSGTLSTAVQDIRSGKSISAVYVPPDFERDLKAARRPQIVGFYNQQFLTPSGIASSGLSDSLSAAAAVAAPASRAAPAPASLGALKAETMALVNPQKNYAQFLLRALLPTIIHVVMTLAAGYSVGSEFRRRDARAWLESAGGDPLVALAGKLAPLFCIFILIMLAEPLFLEGVLEIPFKGDLPLRRHGARSCRFAGTWPSCWDKPRGDCRSRIPLFPSLHLPAWRWSLPAWRGCAWRTSPARAGSQQRGLPSHTRSSPHRAASAAPSWRSGGACWERGAPSLCCFSLPWSTASTIRSPI
ncbi:ABC transporter permease [Bradyrhizobium sp.]|uniref:ABC transporter permease n=1 Tax=Bradyrhizobium sp. TaxID=376 RepID=UPI001FD910F3|nr:ABC transporter permease [Bradyrhizobium sp.]